MLYNAYSRRGNVFKKVFENEEEVNKNKMLKDEYKKELI